MHVARCSSPICWKQYLRSSASRRNRSIDGRVVKGPIHRLKGDRDANDEIGADGAGEIFRGRMGGLLQRSSRTCTTALYCTTTATARADLQSIDSIHRASIAPDPRFTRTAKRLSGIFRGGLAFGWNSTRRGRALASAAGYRDEDIQRRENARKPT